MSILAVVAAAVASYLWGAAWYMAMAKPWMAAAGLTPETVNRSNPVPFIVSFLCTVIVAGMMRHVFAMAGLDTLQEGLIAGFGLGAFIAAPWLVTNYAFAGRPLALSLIDGAYAIVGCAIIGAVLTLF